MSIESPSTALEREHRDIDGGIAAFMASAEAGRQDGGALHLTLDALRRHIYAEEVFLFPPLREAGLTMPILVMEREHGTLWNTMDTLERQLAADAPDGDLMASCTGLLGLLERHNAKEEPIIYPPADNALGEAATAALKEFLDTGRMPGGWTCGQAGA